MSADFDMSAAWLYHLLVVYSYIACTSHGELAKLPTCASRVPDKSLVSGLSICVCVRVESRRLTLRFVAIPEPMGRLSPVATMATTSTTSSAHIEPDFDDGSDSSTSGCSSLSITTPATTEPCSTADAKNNQRRNRPIQNTKEPKTRDVSISVDQTSIVAETCEWNFASLPLLVY